MLARTIGALCLPGGLLLASLGCGHERLPPEKRAAAYGACHDDADCMSAFCDRTVCVPLQPRGDLGGECDPRAPPGLPDAGSLDRGCGEYVCIAGRCRDCRKDEDCETYGAGGQCDNAMRTHGCTGSPARNSKPRSGPNLGPHEGL